MPWSPRRRSTPQRQATRNRRGDPFYWSTAWRRLRAQKLTQSPLCELCRQRGEVVPAAEVHHMQPRAQRPELSLEFANLQALCKSCHSRITLAELRGMGPPPSGVP